MDTRAFPCNMIVTDGKNVCVVKDTCEGCKYDKEAEEIEYQRQVEQYQHDMLYESTFNPEDGSM